MEGAAELDGLSQTACDRNPSVYFSKGVCLCDLCGYLLKETTCGENGENTGAPKGLKIPKLK